MATDDTTAPEPPTFVDREGRQSVFLSTTLERFGTSEITKHRVRDLSPHGMRIDNADGLGRGATVLVAVGLLLAVPATIQWVKDGQAGLAFRVEIDPDQARGKVAIAPKAEAKAKGIAIPKDLRPGGCLILRARIEAADPVASASSGRAFYSRRLVESGMAALR